MAGRFLVVSLLLLVTAFVVPVPAQFSNLDVNIPFDFTVGTRKLAAGQYQITRPVATNKNVLAFRGDAKNQKTNVTTHARTGEEAAKDTEFVFAKYGESYFLRSIRLRGQMDYYEMPVAKSERALAKAGEAEMISIKVEQK